MSLDRPDGSLGEDEVRRALAEAAAGTPARLPEDIEVRLDRTLAELVAQRLPASQRQPDPGARSATISRSRSWAGRRLLLAAAAISVLGLGSAGVVAALHGQTSPTASQASAGRAASHAGAQDGSAPAAGRKPAANPPSAAASPGKTPALHNGFHGAPAIPDLHSTSLAEDVRRLLQRDQAKQDPARSYLLNRRVSSPHASSCRLPAHTRADELFAVRYDRHPATLLVRPAQRGLRTAEVFACHDAATAEASVSIP